MTTFKKKDFKKLVKESTPVDEFVKDDGSVIGGDEPYNKGVDVKTGPINMPDDEKGVAQYTDKFFAQAIQPHNWWWSLNYGYTGPTARATSLSPNNLEDGGMSESETVDEALTSEQRMRNMVEDILSRKSDNKEMVKKTSTSDVNRNNIPDIDELSDTKQIVVGKLNDLIDTIGSSNLSGEEIGIVANYLISKLDTSKLPAGFKTMITKQL